MIFKSLKYDVTWSPGLIFKIAWILAFWETTKCLISQSHACPKTLFHIIYVDKGRHNITQPSCFGQKMYGPLSLLINSSSVFGKARLDAA